MARLTTFTKLIITLTILAVVFFGGRYLLNSNTSTTSTTSTTLQTESNETKEGVEATTSSVSFDYQPSLPLEGTLKAVIVAGAQGFDAFIVRVDQKNNWLVEKKQFGTTLIKEGMATENDIINGIKNYIADQLSYGVPGRNIQFIVSSGASKEPDTKRIVSAIRKLGYVVTEVTPQMEAAYGFNVAVPNEFKNSAFMLDIGSGNTKIAWKDNGLKTQETFGSKYFQNNISATTVANDVTQKVQTLPNELTEYCFVLGGVPFDIAKTVRKGKERYTVLPIDSFTPDGAKQEAGINILRSVASATGCKQFVFDWDANFSIGHLLK